MRAPRARHHPIRALRYPKRQAPRPRRPGVATLRRAAPDNGPSSPGRRGSCRVRAPRARHHPIRALRYPKRQAPRPRRPGVATLRRAASDNGPSSPGRRICVERTPASSERERFAIRSSGLGTGFRSSHFVGDDCSGGHPYHLSRKISAEPWVTGVVLFRFHDVLPQFPETTGRPAPRGSGALDGPLGRRIPTGAKAWCCVTDEALHRDGRRSPLQLRGGREEGSASRRSRSGGGRARCARTRDRAWARRERTERGAGQP